MKSCHFNCTSGRCSRRLSAAIAPALSAIAEPCHFTVTPFPAELAIVIAWGLTIIESEGLGPRGSRRGGATKVKVQSVKGRKRIVTVMEVVSCCSASENTAV